MKLGNVRGRACAFVAGRAVDLHSVSGGELPADPMAYVAASWRERAESVLPSVSGDAFQDVSPADIAAPVPRPGNILAVALNYPGHVQESLREVPQEPAVFSKLTSSLCGPFDPIEIPAGRSMVDFEAEVVVVIGRRMRSVPAAAAWDHVAGITAGQDISDRHEQRRPPGQFSLAKSYDTFSPIGPVMATVDEFTDPEEIAVIGRVSGTEVQRGTTRQLIYSIPDLLAWTCRFVTLEPGDLIFTGTPEGVGARREPPLFLADGMVLETEIPEVGVMRNPIHSTPARPLEVVS